MKLFKSTRSWSTWWKHRKIDWKKDYLSTWNHPHRSVVVGALRLFKWLSLMEIGCGGGANLVKIIKEFPGRQIGGIDISPSAIALCQEAIHGGVFKVGSGDDVMLSDKSTDVILSDMMLIYVGPLKIRKYLLEMKRLARNYVVLCEFHSTSIRQRLLLKLTSGYNAYDYRTLLTKMGFYDILEYKLKEEDWPGGNPQKTFAYIIIARVPKR
jgi:ubiquinone/menaquinone biosynthesis C-methylase UbiE